MLAKLYKRTWMKKEGALEVAAAVLTSVQMKPLTPPQDDTEKGADGVKSHGALCCLALDHGFRLSPPHDAFSGAFCRANLHHVRQNNI